MYLKQAATCISANMQALIVAHTLTQHSSCTKVQAGAGIDHTKHMLHGCTAQQYGEFKAKLQICPRAEPLSCVPA